MVRLRSTVRHEKRWISAVIGAVLVNICTQSAPDYAVGKRESTE